ncbi:MAG: right-handed parallel beta-helix repeat-containing protein [Saprospiraceae bacterium]|nr:right-handed parallel beta-helix repeat-containing protein [Saprospiraceae bacterium]MDW8483691.1 parallel beta-helix domain-containing protein [Saprospiraceae bacterium]
MSYLRVSLVIVCWGCAASFYAQPDAERALQTRFVLAEDGDTLELPAGRIELTNTLWLDGKRDILVRGAGIDRTILSFRSQKQGAEGIKITHAANIVLEGFTLENSRGDLLKAQEVHGLTLRDIKAQWTGKPRKTNGSYALYPVQCRRVSIQRCTAIGASDAGIYVGQSDSVWVRECLAYHNVAGIEIENTTNAWVWNNTVYDNSGGILVFDLPDLPKKQGGRVLVWKNKVLHNNHKNFAPKGNIVAKVPPGTGVMILAARAVEVTENAILDNRTVSTAIVSYYITQLPLQDKEYVPYPADIYVHDNTYSANKRMPTWRHRLGLLLWLKFGRRLPHILYDGIADENHPPARICLKRNINGSFANVDAARGFKNISTNATLHDCTLPLLPRPE